MTKPTITFYIEKKPAHYVGPDIAITLRCSAKLSAGDIENVMMCLQTGLIACEYPFNTEK